MSDWVVDRLLLRDRWIVGGCVAVIAVLAWLRLWREWAAMAPDTSMPGMEMASAAMASPSDAAAYLASAFVMWFLMMIAMMLPSATPMIMLYGGLVRGAREGQAVLAPTSIFAGAYLAVWGGFSVLAALAQWLLVRSGTVSEINLAFGDERVRCVSIAAGLYQATPLKRACLQNCRSPMSFLMRFWRPGWDRRSAPRVHARDLLSRLLRVVDGAAVRFRDHEFSLGRCTSAPCSRRKGLARRATDWRRRRRGRHAHWPPYGRRREVARLSGGRRKLEQSGFERCPTFASSVGQNQKVLRV